MMFKKLAILMSLLVISSQAYSGTVSFDQLATSSDLTVAKYNSDLDTIFQKVNSDIDTGNINDDTLLEADMADEINPRIRDYELGGSGTECEPVYTGLLTTTTSGTLVGSVPSGTAYPRGYRVVKSSATPKTFTADRWTFVDIDINGDFTYSEVAVDGATPAVASNSIRLSRVSTDSTQINNVQDLRTTSCTAGPFSNIKNASNQGSLSDLFTYGSPIKGTGTAGYLQGLQISRDTNTTFLVKAGCAYINGLYRCLTSDETVPVTVDNPSQGTSGIDTGAIATSTLYNVFAVADQDSVNTMSVSFGTGTTPSGVTNYRKLGTIRSDASSQLVSADITQVNNIDQKELVGAYVNFNGTGSPVINEALNVSGVAKNGTGDYTISWDQDFDNAYYAVSGTAGNGDTNPYILSADQAAPTASTLRIQVSNLGGTITNVAYISVKATGERTS